jgi:hypothetical protein
MTHIFDSEISLHYWLLWPTLRCSAEAARTVKHKYFYKDHNELYILSLGTKYGDNSIIHKMFI